MIRPGLILCALVVCLYASPSAAQPPGDAPLAAPAAVEAALAKVAPSLVRIQGNVQSLVHGSIAHLGFLQLAQLRFLVFPGCTCDRNCIQTPLSKSYGIPRTFHEDHPLSSR